MELRLYRLWINTSWKGIPQPSSSGIPQTTASQSLQRKTEFSLTSKERIPLLSHPREGNATGFCLTTGERIPLASTTREGMPVAPVLKLNWLLSPQSREYHKLQGNNTGCCFTLHEGIRLACSQERECHSLLPVLTRGREYHSDTGCCLTSGEKIPLVSLLPQAILTDGNKAGNSLLEPNMPQACRREEP